jgi:hypothetical protein
MIMSYINVGAYVNGKRPASKKAVREAFAADPNSVEFDKTAGLFDGYGSFQGIADLDALPAGTTLVLVGPDPERNRKFYGNVVKTSKGWIVK